MNSHLTFHEKMNKGAVGKPIHDLEQCMHVTLFFPLYGTGDTQTNSFLILFLFIAVLATGQS